MNSNASQEDPPPEKLNEEDLEDGEIEDDEEEEIAQPAEVPLVLDCPPPVPKPADFPVVAAPVAPEPPPDKEKKRDRDRPEKRRHDDKGKKHMTEAEKSILHLRKREEMQRRKWEKIRSKEFEAQDDDFAKNIEKTLATILNKKEKEAAALGSGEDLPKEDEPKPKKRKKCDRERKNKQRKSDSPKSEMDENDVMNMRGGSPKGDENTHSGYSEESFESEYSSDQNKPEEKTRENKKKRKKKYKDKKNKNKERKLDESALIDNQEVCVFYLQGKCLKNDCPYSHEVSPPMKLELCKFYLMDCCAKGENCSYMHSEFPCKFYHTGLKCSQGDDCKFAHGKALSESLKQILFKHIETAPREILGEFPRMSREDALNIINVTQAKLHEQGGENKPEVKGGIPSLFDINVPVPPELLQGCDDVKSKTEKGIRNRPSRWQDPDPIVDREFPIKSFNYPQDQDMRINSNGDVDMRTLPPPKIHDNQELDLERYKREAGVPPAAKQDVDIRQMGMPPFAAAAKDVDIRQQPLLAASQDVDIRQLAQAFARPPPGDDAEDEPMLQIDTGDEKADEAGFDVPPDLPKAQRDLYLRIKANQKDNVVETENKDKYDVDENINWYSDDDDEDDNRLTIKVDNDDAKDIKDSSSETVGELPKAAPVIKPQDVVEKLGDLSKIDISAEVTKLLTSMSQGNSQFSFPKQQQPAEVDSSSPIEPEPVKVSSDPRLSTRQDPRLNPDKNSDTHRTDPRLASDPRQRSRQSSTDTKNDKLSIYEQGSFNKTSTPFEDDIDLRNFKPDVDLRSLQLPFKGMQNYTPASEIDASVSSHPPIHWKLEIVDIPRPDYTGLKLSVSDAEKTGDPRLRKIFRLSTEERDTPLSPKASPKATTTVRVDPRLRKADEPKTDPMSSGMNYNQQINMLRKSAFYQSLTTQQKMLLNNELSQRNDANSNSHDPVLNSLLSNLDLLPGANVQVNHTLNSALALLTNANPKLNSLFTQNAAMVGPLGGPVMNQPGLLGAAPGIPNDFPMNFDPRNGGLLGNAPLPFGGFPPPQDNQGNFNQYDDYYPDNQGLGPCQGGFSGGNRDRGYNRDRRRGRNSFHNRNNSGNRNFRNNRNNNRSNRNHSPP
ncbi:unnamed protein product [Phyllotreta striolata]|uniref:C3H1-type domain-containing protein n=1 Tax=Phyllotreta striolata TaxID=444603 RepID=A0A9P0GYG1_PHYSR|nr:unnamed protein product [Phyllotreta striolata]